jgi:S-adenosylmethionine/arginine decarboxylase-like enzyme
MLDFYNCKEESVDDIRLCYDFLDRLVGFIGMKKQSPPYIFRTDAKEYPSKAGLSGWIPLVESGIQLHTLVAKNFVSIDIYSCGFFDPEKAEEFAIRFFEPEKIDRTFLLRGKEYYK